MTRSEKNKANEIINKYGIVFNQELVSRVERNWLKLENPDKFDGLTSEQKCIAFVWLSNDENRETGLAGEIIDVIMDAMFESTK